MGGEAPRAAAAIGAGGSSVHAHTHTSHPSLGSHTFTQHNTTSMAVQRLKVYSAAASPEIRDAKCSGRPKDEMRVLRDPRDIPCVRRGWGGSLAPAGTWALPWPGEAAVVNPVPSVCLSRDLTLSFTSAVGKQITYGRA